MSSAELKMSMLREVKVFTMPCMYAEFFKSTGRVMPEMLSAYMTEHASGIDARANIDSTIELFPDRRIIVPTGLKVAVPVGCEIQVRPRSGLAWNSGVTVLNTPGTIDADYRGEIKVILINHGELPVKIYPAERIAQLVLCPILRICFNEVDSEEELGETLRGTGGFGHTGQTS